MHLNLALPLLREELGVNGVENVGHLDAVGHRGGRGQLDAEAGRQPAQDGVGRRRRRHIPSSLQRFAYLSSLRLYLFTTARFRISV